MLLFFILLSLGAASYNAAMGIVQPSIVAILAPASAEAVLGALRGLSMMVALFGPFAGAMVDRSRDFRPSLLLSGVTTIVGIALQQAGICKLSIAVYSVGVVTAATGVSTAS